MSFFDLLSEAQRTLMMTAAERIDLPRGQYLLRRGQPGGDVYLVRAGTLEVVDSRTTPEVILAALTEGAMVGEMAFIDNSPRSADVRAGADAVVLRWPQAELRALLKRNPEFAAVFYESLAKMASERTRTMTTSAVTGGIGRASPGARGAQEEARALAETTKEALLGAETRLRQNAQDREAATAVHRALDALQAQIAPLFATHSEKATAEIATKTLGRELHPYLVRSSLADLCIRRPQGIVGTAEILSHVQLDVASGDGQLGELLDRWLLDRPTMRAHRVIREPLMEAALDALPKRRNRRMLIIDAGTGSLVATLVPRLAGHPTVVTVVDQSRDALAFLDATLIDVHHEVQIHSVQENLVQLAGGKMRHPLPPQDVVIVQGLLEYMPDRIAVSMLQSLKRLLAPGGTIIGASLAPSDDQFFLDRVLGWPSLRRSHEAVKHLWDAAGLGLKADTVLPGPAQLVLAEAH